MNKVGMSRLHNCGKAIGGIVIFHQSMFELVIVQTKKQLNELAIILEKAKFHFWDSETSGLRVKLKGNDYAAGFTFAVEDAVDKRVFYIPVAHTFEGEYFSHINLEKLKLDPADFPSFNDSVWLKKSYKNMDYDVVMKVLKPALEKRKVCGNTKVLITEDCYVRVEGNYPIRVAHNQMYDWHVLANCDIDVNKMTEGLNYSDTMLMFHTVQEEEPKKLEEIIRRCYDIKKTDYDDIVATVTLDEKKSIGWGTKKAIFPHVQIPIGAQYSAEDVWFMKQLYPQALLLLEEDEQLGLYNTSRLPLMPVLWQMERDGIPFNMKRAKEMELLGDKVLEDLRYKMLEIAGIEINLKSTQQVNELLFGWEKVSKDKKTGIYAVAKSSNKAIIAKSFKFPVLSWTTGGKEKDKKLRAPQTDEDTVTALLFKDYTDKRKKEGQRFLKLLQKFNSLKKLHGTYIVGMQNQIYQDGKLHCGFNICGTVSWRLSCSEPALQTLPKPLEGDEDDYDFWIQFEIRELFTTEDVKNRYIAAFD